MPVTRLRPLPALLVLLLAGCATTGPASPSARPVFYPNATFNRVGSEQAQREADQCLQQARNAGLTPQEQDSPAGRSALQGAAVGGVAAAVGALVDGQGPERALRSGAAGAAVGGSAGAVSGAMQAKPNATYRHYVQRCLHDKGFDVIGWN
ncbi:MAG: hypothetical protein RLZZ22_307 [Pseudomonadota bacterium]|jgi:hypothetical protein